MNATLPGQTSKGARRRGPVLFAALVALVLVAAIAGIEIARRPGPGPAALGPNSSARDRAPAPFPRELRDASGETLRIPARPQRIVSQTLGTDEILLAICAPERIVALSVFALDPRYSNIAAEARPLNLETVEGPEQILRLNPDLIFVASYSRAEVVDLLRASRAPVFRFANFDTIEDIKQNIRTVGYATGDDERAEAVVAEMEREIAAVRARIPSGSKPLRVMSYGPSGNTAGAGTLFDDIVRTVGAINVTAEQGLGGFPTISAEQVAAWQPDFIVAGADTNRFDETRRRLLSDPAIAASRAGRAGRLILIDNRYFLTVSQHVVKAIRALADGLYGT
jgi:iron complex transport system substrate-binding protein